MPGPDHTIIRAANLLPKAHLHLHFTGSMRPATLKELAAKHGIRLPEIAARAAPAPAHPGRARLVPVPAALRRRPRLRARRRGHAPDRARGRAGRRRRGLGLAGAAGRPDVVRALRRRPHPRSGDRAGRRGRGRPDAPTARSAIVVAAASRIRHPLDARTLARLAARYAGDGPATVVGFGLSNDERRGQHRGVRRGLPDRRPGRTGQRAALAANCWGPTTSARRWPP